MLKPGLVLLAGVGVAARVLEHPALSVEQDGRRHQPFDEVTVVADQQHCAFVVGDHFLQQVEGLQIKVVGRLVEHQQVAGVGEALGQRQAVALTPRKRVYRRPRHAFAEQKVPHVGDHVPGMAPHHDLVAADVGQIVPDRRAGAQAGPHLVEHQRFEVGAAADAALIGVDAAQQHFDQRGFARTIGADDADPVAAQNAGRERRDDLAPFVGLGDALGLDHTLARGAARRAV